MNVYASEKNLKPNLRDREVMWPLILLALFYGYCAAVGAAAAPSVARNEERMRNGEPCSHPLVEQGLTYRFCYICERNV